jgi:cytochrome c
VRPHPCTLLLAAGLVLGAGPSALAQDGQLGGLPAGRGQEETYYACSACHSIHLVTQQRLPRRRWDHLLDWMVAEQGMAELPAADRTLILDYLATHLNPDVPRS